MKKTMTPLKLLVASISVAVASADSAEILQSPNQKIEVALNTEEGDLGYSVKSVSYTHLRAHETLR